MTRLSEVVFIPWVFFGFVSKVLLEGPSQWWNSRGQRIADGYWPNACEEGVSNDQCGSVDPKMEHNPA